MLERKEKKNKNYKKQQQKLKEENLDVFYQNMLSNKN